MNRKTSDPHIHEWKLPPLEYGLRINVLESLGIHRLTHIHVELNGRIIGELTRQADLESVREALSKPAYVFGSPDAGKQPYVITLESVRSPMRTRIRVRVGCDPRTNTLYKDYFVAVIPTGFGDVLARALALGTETIPSPELFL
jgi:hypothetical protein